MRGLNIHAAGAMTGLPIYVDLEKAEIVWAQFLETAKYRNNVLRAVAIMVNHLRFAIQVPGDPDSTRVLGDYKAYSSRALNRRFGMPSSEWTEKGSKRKFSDDAALAAAIYYVLYKQPKPLLVWSPETGRIK